MIFLPKFYYEAGAENNGGGGSDAPTEKKTEIPTPEAKVVENPILSPDELKEFGFDSPEKLKDFLRTQREQSIPEEEKTKKINIEKANLLKFSTEKGLMNVEDYNQLENLKAKKDLDLVFEKFSSEHKEDFPDASEEDIKDAFESEYKLNSDNDKVKTRSEAKLAKEAQELRSPFEQKYSKAEGEYKAEQRIRSKIPEYNGFIDGLIKELTPDKLVLFKTKDGENEVSVDIDLTEDDRKEITKTFKNEKTFYNFIQSEGNLDTLKPALVKKITSFLKEKYFDNTNEKSFKTGKDIGVKSGSNVGAENPYALTDKNKGAQEAVVLDINASNAKIAEARARVRGNR